MKNKRIHVTFDDTTLEIISIIAKKENRSLSDVVRRKVEDWFENYEDQYWADMASLIKVNEEDTIPAEEVWKCIK